MSVILVYFLTQKHLWLQKSMLREVRNWIIRWAKFILGKEIYDLRSTQDLPHLRFF